MPGEILKFAEFELDPSNYILSRGGERVMLRPQAFRVLELLVRRAGTLVTREELRQTVWPGDVTIDFEHGLNTCMRQVRAALTDQADGPRFIETVPRVGYRFIAPVQHAENTQPHGTFTKGNAAPPLVAGRGRDHTWFKAVPVALTIVAMVALVLGYGGWISSSRSRTSETNELYVRGRMLLDGWTPGGVRAALGVFEQLVALDPTHAGAHAGMALAYLQRPSGINGIDPAVAFERGRQAVERALALDASAPEAYSALAELCLRRRDWSGARDALRRAVELGPTYVRIRAQFADLLALQGRFDEALVEARIGESLDPLSPRARHEVASVLRYARRFDEAIAQALRTLEIDPNFGPAHFTLGHAYLALRRYDMAVDAFGRSGRGPTGNLGHALALAGRTSEAREILHALEQQFAMTHAGEGAIAQVLVGLGEYDAAFDWLTLSVERGNGFTLKVATVWDPLREDPRFLDLLDEAGLTP
jgi:DNA-binding winged helix-turn-helix (wHTH) protein/tetratricopeptide (TPR) repeat protein